MTLRRIAKDESWKAEAACVGRHDVNWYPDRSESTSEARAICGGCPVRQACLTYAQTPPYERFGIFGGLSERQRQYQRTTRWQLRNSDTNDMEAAS